MLESKNGVYWADAYLAKKVTAEQAISHIRSGQRVFIGSGCGEPQKMIKTLVEKTDDFSGLEIVRLFGRETASLAEIADRTRDSSLNIRSIYLGATQEENIAKQQRFITPMNMSDVPLLFASRRLPLNVAIVQVSPPDDFGWMSLGISVDVTMSAARSADIVIAQVNSMMPRVMGQSFLHVNDVDLLVEHDEELNTVVLSGKDQFAAQTIGKYVAGLVEDGATLQIGLAVMSQAMVAALSNKNDLGLHSQFITDDAMHLYATGNINNKRKGINEGKMVASMAIGSHNLYEFLNDNPAVDFYPTEYVNEPLIIAQHHKMVSLNVARAIDLTGQATAEATAVTRFAGISGIPDFVRGARRSLGGKSILMLYSFTVLPDGTRVSNIVARLNDMVVVVPRGDMQYVVTEYGVVNLFGKSIQERVIALISIAHPDFRESLFREAKELGYIGSERTLGEAARAVYPIQLEETITRNGVDLLLRPAKPTDERLIQEHYYNLSQQDVESRFFYKKTVFAPDEIEERSYVDYINDLTLVAIIGEVGFEQVVGVAECMKIETQNMAEVAFSMSEEFRGLGIGRLLLRKLAAVAMENGIEGLVAVTTPRNTTMIRLFKSLPYKIESIREEGDLILTCKFDDRPE